MYVSSRVKILGGAGGSGQTITVQEPGCGVVCFLPFALRGAFLPLTSRHSGSPSENQIDVQGAEDPGIASGCIWEADYCARIRCIRRIDGVLDPILTDSDGTADGDGQSNLAEVTLTLTDPLDGNSRFFITVAADPGNADGAHLSMPTLTGRIYAIERSHDLLTWSSLSVIIGDDTTRLIPVAGDPLERANFFRVEVSLP